MSFLFVQEVAASSAAIIWKKKGKKEEKVEVKKETPYEKFFKGKKCETVKGLIILHKMDNKIYFELPLSLLGKDMLIGSTVTEITNNGFANVGEKPHEPMHVMFTRTDSTINLRQVTCAYMSKDRNLQERIKTSMMPAIIENLAIKAYSPDSTAVVIDMTNFLLSDNEQLNPFSAYAPVTWSGAWIEKEFKRNNSQIAKIKAFDDNVSVQSSLTYSVSLRDKRSYYWYKEPFTAVMTRTFLLLPEEPMRPRLADPRINIFWQGYSEFSNEGNGMKPLYYANRWRLEPKPEDVEKYKRGEVVEPVKPIVFYIDPSTPKQWREEIKAGVRDWQAAFEAAGFKNAVVAKDAPEGDEDFDIDDIRYSVITYAASQQANAMGPSVVDPRSGEIIEADVVWWHNVMSLLHTWMRVQTAPIDPRARANKLSDEHMASAIRFVSSHEVGHTFGLKHNMGASHAFPVDSLRSPSFTAKMGGTASSIMDYARFNYVAQPGDGVKEITPKIGTYDKFAINWAYRWLDTETPQEELPILNEWIQEHEGDPMYWYGEQQDPKDPIDPRSQDEDLGDDIVKANRYGIMNLKRIVPNIVAWTEEDGESFAEAGKLLMAVINQWKMYAGHVTANVGGIYINNPVKGSPEDRYIPVPKEIQKESVKYLIEEVFIVPEWLFGAEVWKKSYPIQMGVEYSPYTVARELQYATFYNLLKDERLLRMFDSEATLGRAKSYTPEEMFADIHNVIFASSKAGRNLSIYERMTQKNFVDAIIVSSNRAVEKTTKKALHHSNTCCFASKVPEFTIEPREEVQLRTLHFSSMGRVSEAVSVKRGELLKILKLAENKRNTGNVETRNHYEDLIIRVKEALNM